MSFYSIPVKTLTHQTFDLKSLQGQVILIVNVASKCGFTPQYAGLEKLYSDYKGAGLTVLGVPCNQFGSQEPGTEAEIGAFCSAKYSVTFPILEKSDVNGASISPLYAHLKSILPGDVKWNFEKFIVDRQGNIVSRFDSRKTPAELESILKGLL